MSSFNILSAQFVLSVHLQSQLPDTKLPEIAFAGRSNVGKSSLLNSILYRKQLVKVSARPGKTQGLNFFLVGERCHFVDLPGYGFAKVAKSMRQQWGDLISGYLQQRQQLNGVVVIIDIRHEAKQSDADLIQWLAAEEIPFCVVYTKADKLSGNARARQTRLLDVGHGLSPAQRLVYSAKTHQGREALLKKVGDFLAEAEQHKHLRHN